MKRITGRLFLKNICATIIIALLSMVRFSMASNESYTRGAHYYHEKRGGHTCTITRSVSRQKGYQIIYKKADEKHITDTDETLATITWTMDNPDTKTVIHAIRKNNTIYIKGIFKGDPIKRSIEVDSAPWFQATSLSLKDFALSEQTEVQFWMLRPLTLNPYKLKAVKEGTETLTFANKPVASIKIKLQLNGWLAPFWESFYWFRAEDGFFLRFAGMDGLSRSSLMIVTYIHSDRSNVQADPLPSQRRHLLK